MSKTGIRVGSTDEQGGYMDGLLGFIMMSRPFRVSKAGVKLSKWVGHNALPKHSATSNRGCSCNNLRMNRCSDSFRVQI